MPKNTWLTNLQMTDGMGSNYLGCHINIVDESIAQVVTENKNFDKFDAGSRVISLDGCWVGPGFCDAHTHPVSYGLSLDRLNLDGLSAGEIVQTLQVKSNEVDGNIWIRGRGWEDAFWSNSSGLNKYTLDRLFSENPVALTSKDGHSIWLNSRALHELEFKAEESDPPGGKFDRFPGSREITGILRENALEIAIQRMPETSNVDKLNGLKKGLHKLNSMGITTIHSFEGLQSLAFSKQLYSESNLTMRILEFLMKDDLEAALENNLKSGDGNAFIQIGGLKLFADGALGSRTAYVKHPYDGSADDRGLAVTPFDEMEDLAVRAASGNLATAIHAIGDQAVSDALQTLVSARKMNPKLPGHRIEHIQLLDPLDLPKFKACNIMASVQPIHMVSDISMVERYWAGQSSLMYPYNSLFQTGIDLKFGSDIPIDDGNPLAIIQAAVTRQPTSGHPVSDWVHPEKMDLLAAMACITGTGLHGNHSRTFGHGLKTGKIADLVILESNPFLTAPDKIHCIPVQMTICNGQIVHS